MTTKAKLTANSNPSKQEESTTRLPRHTIERVQTGVRMERRILSTLKAVADLHQITLGDLLEGIVLHAFEGKAPFSEGSLKKIQAIKEVFGLDLTAEDSHMLVEQRIRNAKVSD